MDIYVGNDIELSMLKSAYSDIEYGTSTVALLWGPRGCGKTTLARRMLAKAGIDDAQPYAGSLSGLGSLIEQGKPIWLDDIHTLGPDSLGQLSEICCKLAGAARPSMIILSYSTAKAGGINAPFMAFVSELKTSLGGAELLDIEMKPLSLADVHLLISRQYAPNIFNTSFANQLHKASQGNPLMLRQILNHLSNQGSLAMQSGAWQLTNGDISLDLIAAQIEQDCASEDMPREATHQQAAAPEQKLGTISDIEQAVESLEALIPQYKMAKALAGSAPIEDAIAGAATSGSQASSLLARTAIAKCRALIFLGLYKECEDAASSALNGIHGIEPEHKAMATALMAQAIGYQSRYSESFTQFDIAISIALSCQSHSAAAAIYCLKVPFLLEYPLLDKVQDSIDRGIKHSQQAGCQREYWELQLYSLYYYRYISKTDEALERSAEVLKYFRESGDPKYESRTLNAIGLLNSSLCRFSKAGEYYASAISLLKSIDDKVGLIGIYNNMGHLGFDIGQYESSISNFREALAISSSISSKSLMMVSYTGIGTSLLYLGKSAEAEQSLLKGLEIARTLENKSSQAYALSALGDFYSHESNTEKALEVYLMALDIDREIKDTPSIVCDLTNIANVHINTRDFDNGIKYLEGIKEEMPDYASNVAISAAIDNTFGNLYAEKGDSEKALQYYKSALGTNEKCGDHICASLNYYNIGLLYVDMDDFDSAIEYFKSAVKHDRLSGDKMQLAQHLQRLAFCLRTIDEPQQSHQLNMEAASLLRQLGLMDDCAIAMRYAGDDARAMESFQNAEKLLSESADMLSISQNLVELADTHAALGVLYTDTQKPQKAEKSFKAAVGIHIGQSLGCHDRFSKIAQQMAWSCSKLHEEEKGIKYLQEIRGGCSQLYYLEITMTIAKMLEDCKDSKAADYYTEAAGLAMEIDDDILKCDIIVEAAGYLNDNNQALKSAEFVKKALSELKGHSDDICLCRARIKVALADSYEAQGSYEKAVKYYNEALKVFEEQGEKWDAACVFNNIGYIYDNTSRCLEAAQYYHKAFCTYKELDNRESMAKNLYNEALMYERMSDTKNAATAYRHALKYIDEDENPAGYAATLLNAAKCMSTYSNSDEPASLASKAYDLFRDAGQAEEAIQCQEFMALYRFQQKNMQAARSHLSMIIGIKDFWRDSRIQIMAEISAASICFYMDNLSECMEHFHKAIATATEIDSWPAIAVCNAHLAAKMSMDDSKLGAMLTSNGKTRTVADFCIECLNFAIKIAGSEGNNQMKSDALEVLSTIYSKTGDISAMMKAIDSAIECSDDAEHRTKMLMQKAVATKEKLGDMNGAINLMIQVLKSAQESRLWEIRLMAGVWVSYWRLQEDPSDSYSIQILEDICKKSGYLIFKVPGLAELIEKL